MAIKGVHLNNKEMPFVAEQSNCDDDGNQMATHIKIQCGTVKLNNVLYKPRSHNVGHQATVSLSTIKVLQKQRIYNTCTHKM